MTKTDRPSLLDVNALIALAWDSHVHHATIRAWFTKHAAYGWATCPITESGFVGVSSNPKVLPSPIGVQAAREVLALLRAVACHRFVTDDVSVTHPDFPAVNSHRQVTDVHLLALARRHGFCLLTFDKGLTAQADGRDIQLLTAF